MPSPMIFNLYADDDSVAISYFGRGGFVEIYSIALLMDIKMNALSWTLYQHVAFVFGTYAWSWDSIPNSKTVIGKVDDALPNRTLF